jgi:hypothetical protein
MVNSGFEKGAYLLASWNFKKRLHIREKAADARYYFSKLFWVGYTSFTSFKMCWIFSVVYVLGCNCRDVRSVLLFMVFYATVEIIGKSRFTRSLSYVKFQPKKIVQK